MTKRMLIDATHAEETRVAIADKEFLVEFDYESKLRKQLKGSIFLAKVTRVEPSLQAAFVNFGGNRHGFLPFSEIHPDYFRIPVADREALIEAQRAALEERDRDLEEEDDDDAESSEDEKDVTAEDDQSEEDSGDDDFVEEEEDVVEVGGADKPADDEDDEDNSDGQEDVVEEEAEASAETSEEEGDSEDESEEEASDKRKGRRGRGGRGRGRGRRYASSRSRRSEKYDDEDKPFRFDLRRHYKIQEVVKRGQIVLVQASKEERGNKGAAVTTYLSLPGRYCVLMPNSPRGGGVSRKIGSYQERKRLKKVLADLNIPDGMSVILRTAGVGRTKAEIKRDLDYLLRLWNNIREDTLASTAPSLIYEEGNLIKRSIRDLYDKDIEEVFVAGEEGTKNAKAFMKMLMPSHVKRVKEYKDDKIPLFHKYNIENQISEIGRTTVTMKSGGYLVINPTEALVSVDVNSGRATKERHIEETALKTNMEAAEEVARQMRLRDLGGLVVIDFIDMEDRRNNRKVENKLRQALSKDRARIQVGRISSFGLLELSRQRLNPSLTEMQFETCPECGGLGRVPTLDFAAVKVIRALEGEGIKGGAKELSLTVPSKISFYLLNQKREMMSELESRYEMKVFVRADDEMAISDYTIEALKKRGKKDSSDEEEAQPSDQETEEEGEAKKQGRGSRRRGRRGGRSRRGRGNAKADDQTVEEETASKTSEEEGDTKKPARKKRATKKSSKKSKAKTEEKSESEAKEQADSKAEKKDLPKPSNDIKPDASAPKDYETVNEAPKQKKKGWWSKVTGE